MTTGDYDICVVGAGLIGSAAAKYLAKKAIDCRVLLIGPSEPQRSDYDDQNLFGAWYDEGRITRTLDMDLTRAKLARASIGRYRDIEKESGIEFFTENGFLAAAPIDSTFHQQSMEVAKKLNIPVTLFRSGSEIQERFQFFRPIPDHYGVYEEHGAGRLNPRNLILAQKNLARRNNCATIDDVVVKVEVSNSQNYRWNIHTEQTGQFRANRIVLAPGSFVFHHDLFPKNINIKRPVVKLMGAIVNRIPVEESKVRELYLTEGRLFPSMMFQRETEDDQREGFHRHPRFYWCMAPCKYPDGCWYMKFGDSGDFWMKELRAAEEVTQWYREAPIAFKERAVKMAQAAKRFFPDLDTSKYVTDACVTSTTPKELPYIDEIASDFFLANGGNGYSAKCSDEIGRLVANLVLSEPWDMNYRKEDFACDDFASKL